MLTASQLESLIQFMSTFKNTDISKQLQKILLDIRKEKNPAYHELISEIAQFTRIFLTHQIIFLRHTL